MRDGLASAGKGSPASSTADGRSDGSEHANSTIAAIAATRLCFLVDPSD
jgi:hypothetical protein